MGRLFEGGAEREGRGVVYDLDGGERRRLHADEMGRCVVFVGEAGDGGGWGLIGWVVRVVGGHVSAVAGTVFVFAGEGGGEGVHVGDVVAECRVQAVRVLVRETVRDEDGELVGRVWV